MKQQTASFQTSIADVSSISAQRNERAETLSTYAALFASLSTLVCCALPAVLVLVGFGLTTVLAFFTAIPGWESFGIYEMWYFALTAGLLAAGFYFAYLRHAPDDPTCEIPGGDHESACSTATRWNRRILWLSLSLYGLALVMNFWAIGWMRDQGYFNHYAEEVHDNSKTPTPFIVGVCSPCKSESSGSGDHRTRRQDAVSSWDLGSIVCESGTLFP